MQVRNRTWWHSINWSYVHKSITCLSNSWNEAEEMLSQWFNAQVILHSGLLSLCPLLHVHVFYPMHLEVEELCFKLFPAAEGCLVITLLVSKYSYRDFLGQRGCNEVQGKSTATSWILIAVDLCDAAVNTFHKTWLERPGRSTVTENLKSLLNEGVLAQIFFLKSRWRGWVSNMELKVFSQLKPRLIIPNSTSLWFSCPPYWKKCLQWEWWPGNLPVASLLKMNAPFNLQIYQARKRREYSWLPIIGKEYWQD